MGISKVGNWLVCLHTQQASLSTCKHTDKRIAHAESLLTSLSLLFK